GASVNTVPDSLFQAFDGRIWYFPEIRNRWSTLGSASETDWLAIDFGREQQLSSLKIYLYSDEKTFFVPQDIIIEYLNNDKWVPVNITSANPGQLTGNTGNTITFGQILTNMIRISFIHKTGQVAVSEIECYN
ncbi:MAG: discoidin domain-containing protein, partial [Bacteroidales bacterium]|nr:discoidin domain-containing protein [Bacteroidales bacterium]